MSRGSTSRYRRASWSVGVAGAVLGANLAAQDVALRRWRANPDPLAGHGRRLAGEEIWVQAPDGARIGAVVMCPSPAAREHPSVVLAHGYTGNRDNWCAVASALVGAGRRVVAYDQRGHGTSSVGSNGFALTTLGEDLAAVVRNLAPCGAILVGHSMGGVGVQDLLVHHRAPPGSVRGVVLVATLARSLENPVVRLMARAGKLPAARIALGNARWGRLLSRGAFGRKPFTAGLDVVRAGWLACPDATRAGFASALADFDLSADLERLRLPEGVGVTVVCGDRDQVTPLAENRRLAGLLGTEVQVLAGIGHEVPLEVPIHLAEVVDHA